MRRNIKFILFWHVCNVTNGKTANFMLFSCYFYKFFFVVAIVALFFSRKICLVVIYVLLCGEKFVQNLRVWRKMTIMRSELAQLALVKEQQTSL